MADLRTTWEAVTTDDTGADLANGQPDSYRIYRVGEAAPIATVAGDVLMFTEAGAVTQSGTYSREVTAVVAGLESVNRGVGSATIVQPGDVVNITIQGV